VRNQPLKPAAQAQVRRRRFAQDRRAQRVTRTPTPPRLRQTPALQQVPHRARRQPCRRRFVQPQTRDQLARTPARVLFTQRDQTRRHGCVNSLRLPMPGPAAIQQPKHCLGAVAIQPFVAGLAADPVAHAQHTERRLGPQTRRHKLHPAVHHTHLGPGHWIGPPEPIQCDPSDRSRVSPICPVCTHAGP